MDTKTGIKDFFYLGQKINITKSLFRNYVGDYATWDELEIYKPKEVIIIGIRNLSNGHMYYDDGGREYVRGDTVKALLVVSDLRSKPFYIKYPNV